LSPRAVNEWVPYGSEVHGLAGASPPAPPSARGWTCSGRGYEGAFSGFVRTQRDRDKPRGCLIVSGALACGAEAETVRRELAQLRQAAVTALRERFERAVQDGDLPDGSDCATLAPYVATVVNGLAVQAASAATEKELRLVSAMSMRAWPSWSVATSAVYGLRRVGGRALRFHRPKGRTTRIAGPRPQGRKGSKNPGNRRDWR